MEAMVCQLLLFSELKRYINFPSVPINNQTFEVAYHDVIFFFFFIT